MKIKITQFLILLFFFYTTQAFSNPINKISFIGLNNTIESTLLKTLPFKLGQNFSNDTSDKISKSLLKTGYFSDISVVKNSNNLIITVKENPYVKYFDVNLSSKFSWKSWLSGEEQFFTEAEINEYIKRSELSPGDIYSKVKFNDFILSLENEYIASGFFNIEINQNIEIDSENRIGIDLSLTQGTKATISSMSILGLEKFGEKNLLKLFKLGESDFFMLNFFTQKNQYSDIEFNNGLKALNNFYLNSGYLDFQIVNVNKKLSSDQKELSIEIQISEGIQYKLGSVSFTGDLGNQTNKTLDSLLKIKEGDIFNRESVIKDIQTITNIYSDQGYAFVDIKPITSDFLDSVNVEIDISLNKKVYINRITISGNTRTQDEVIRREIGISEGGLYSRSTLNASIRKLRNLGYFSNVEMNVSPLEGIKDKLDLHFAVEETKTGSISMSVSHSNNYGVSLGAGIQEKNIFGSGNTLNADLKLSESFNRVSFYFEDPYFNKDNHSISYGAYISELKDNSVIVNSYEVNTKGISLGYGVPLTENTRLNTKIEYSKNTVKCGLGFASSSYELSQCALKDTDDLKISVNWSESTLNHYMYPTNGKSNVLGLNLGLPISDYGYFKMNANHSSYTPINENLTLKLTGDLGVAGRLSGKSLPFYKRFFGGGSGSVRGFGNRSLGPLYPNNEAKGGELSILGSLNLIAPAYFFGDADKMRMSAFIDAGNIFDKNSNLKLGDIRMSTGAGFAYLSPIGAIGMYWSTPILKKTGDTIENFSFTLGTGF